MLVDPVKHYFYIWLIQPLRKQNTVSAPQNIVLN